MFEIDLEWSVANEYVLRPVERGAGPDLGIYPAEGARITRYRPLEKNPAVYAEFIKLDGSEQSCLQFAKTYGLLFDNGSPETLRDWNYQIQHINDTINLCKLSRSNPAEAFRRFGKQSTQLWSDVKIFLSIKSSNSPATLDVRASDLLSAIEMQAIKSILLADRRLEQCIECGTWFEIGRGARRSQSKFCSVRCKDGYYNRLKAQARRTSHA
jgi:hypothetical protein